MNIEGLFCNFCCVNLDTTQHPQIKSSMYIQEYDWAGEEESFGPLSSLGWWLIGGGPVDWWPMAAQKEQWEVFIIKEDVSF